MSVTTCESSIEKGEVNKTSWLSALCGWSWCGGVDVELLAPTQIFPERSWVVLC